MYPKNKLITDWPRVAVCLAAYDGVEYLNQQVDSILAQESVNVTIFVSIDKSPDGTEQLIKEYSKKDHRVIALPYGEVFGSAGSNFFRALIEVDSSKYDYVSFADQDDIWIPKKLSRHIQLVLENNAEGVSSNVMAFWPDGRKKLLNKAQAQKTFDYLFESAGPGCTFLMTPWLVNKVREQLMDVNSPAKKVALHDWLTYAVCRAHGRKWVIDTVPSVLYRQHQSNVLGANVGLKAKLARLAKLSQGWYRGEVIKIVQVCNRINPNTDTLKIAKLLQSDRFCNRISLLAFMPQSRRSLLARFTLGFCILVGLF